MEQKRKNLKNNLLFALILLAVAGGLWLWQRTRQAPGVYAQLSYGENVQVDLDLSQNGTFDYDTGLYTIHLQVENGAVRFVNSPCPDHLCEHYGWLSAEGDWAACLPAQAVVTVLGQK